MYSIHHFADARHGLRCVAEKQVKNRTLCETRKECGTRQAPQKARHPRERQEQERTHPCKNRKDGPPSMRYAPDIWYVCCLLIREIIVRTHWKFSKVCIPVTESRLVRLPEYIFVGKPTLYVHPLAWGKSDDASQLAPKIGRYFAFSWSDYNSSERMIWNRSVLL